MSKRNKNNSIIFLTTLSVYLGLVLGGGAAPSVLAQAALARNFDVQDEIEVKDDLDKKPNDFADEKNQSRKFYDQVIADYAEVVRGLLKASRQANPKEFSYLQETKSDFAGNLQIKRAFFTKLDDREQDSRQIFHKITAELNKLLKLCPAQISYFDSNIIVGFATNDKGFTTESKFLQKDGSDALGLLSAYNASLQRLRSEAVNERQALILKHTEITVENNLFVIITRLPRGSLDELLKNAKAESK